MLFFADYLADTLTAEVIERLLWMFQQFGSIVDILLQRETLPGRTPAIADQSNRVDLQHQRRRAAIRISLGIEHMRTADR